jgi:hypothetical protein
MNKQIKNLTLVMITILMLSACAGFGTVSESTATPEPVIVVTENPTEAPSVFPTDEVTPERFSQYIGLVYPPLPDGLSPRFSMIIQSSDDNGLSLFIDGGSRMLWLSKLYGYDESGNPTWQVMDILDLSQVEVGAALLPDGCFLNGKPEPEIIVAGRNGVVVIAWRANATLDKFESIPTAGITCDSDKAVTLN